MYKNKGFMDFLNLIDYLVYRYTYQFINAIGYRKHIYDSRGCFMPHKGLINIDNMSDTLI